MPVTSERMEHDMKERCWIGRKVGVDGESGGDEKGRRDLWQSVE
jgi:aromatic ring-cleaving dioxygenase